MRSPPGAPAATRLVRQGGGCNRRQRGLQRIFSSDGRRPQHRNQVPLELRARNAAEAERSTCLPHDRLLEQVGELRRGPDAVNPGRRTVPDRIPVSTRRASHATRSSSVSPGAPSPGWRCSSTAASVSLERLLPFDHGDSTKKGRRDVPVGGRPRARQSRAARRPAGPHDRAPMGNSCFHHSVWQASSASDCGGTFLRRGAARSAVATRISVGKGRFPLARTCGSQGVFEGGRWRWQRRIRFDGEAWRTSF
jgi:hypothetical protein